MKSHRSLRADAARVWTAALRASDSNAAVHGSVKRRGHLLRIAGRTLDLAQFRAVWVLGAGKAAASMAQALEEILGKYLSGGIVVTKYGHSLPLRKIEVVEAGHPLPDANGVAGGARMISFVGSRIHAGDLGLCPISGGGSALLVAPSEGITLADKLACTRLLLNSGATIREMNVIRKHLSRLKGGGLARLLSRTTAISLIISDVVGDPLDTIASGPLVPDTSTFDQALEIIHRLRITSEVPQSVMQRLNDGAAGRVAETPKAGDPIFRRATNIIVAGNSGACSAAAREARRLGYHTLVLTTRLEGDTTEAAHLHMSIAEEIVFGGRPVRRPACLITGGETTVRVTGSGNGGRNQEFTAYCVPRLAHLPAPCVVASVGTDGTDGPTDAAGALADNTTLARSLKFGAQFLQESLRNNNSHEYFMRLGDLIITGPTRTNVMDLHIVLLG
jgi:glycerate 2-kinase